MKFRDYLNDISISNENVLNEVQINFGTHKNTQFGQVVILAGGTGSGKGFVKNNLLDVDGYMFDVDELKTLALKSKLITNKIRDDYGINTDDMNLKNVKDTSILHKVIDDLALLKKIKSSLGKSIIAAHPERKPNLIFDVTLKSIKKLSDISSMCETLGYKKDNMHIVWVLNDLDTALAQNAQNASRDRRVDDDILIDTHRMVSYQMHNLLNSSTKLQKYINGYVYIVFNKKYTDSVVKYSQNFNDEPKTFKTKTDAGKYVSTAFYALVKEKNKDVKSFDDLDNKVLKTLLQRVPDPSIWTKNS